jgi:hypothetical protein
MNIAAHDKSGFNESSSIAFLYLRHSPSYLFIYLFLLIRIVGGGVQLCPLGTSATEWPIVSAPGDYDDGEFGEMKIGRGNRSTRRKPAPAPLCPLQIPLDQNWATILFDSASNRGYSSYAV